MSIFSAVAAFLAVVARPAFRVEPDPDNARIVALEAELDDLKRDLGEARAQRDRWETLAIGWQRRYEQAINPVVAREIAAQEVAQRQMNQLMQAQMAQSQNAQMAQYHQAQMMGMQNQVGLLGAFEGFCNCVPARHDMFLPSGQRL